MGAAFSIRRRPKPAPGEMVAVRSVTVQDGPHHYAARTDQTVLDAANRTADAKIRFACKGGGCGLCRIQLRAGAVATGAMSAAHVPPEAIAEGYVLACRTYAESDIEITRAIPERKAKKPTEEI